MGLSNEPDPTQSAYSGIGIVIGVIVTVLIFVLVGVLASRGPITKRLRRLNERHGPHNDRIIDWRRLFRRRNAPLATQAGRNPPQHPHDLDVELGEVRPHRSGNQQPANTSERPGRRKFVSGGPRPTVVLQRGRLSVVHERPQPEPVEHTDRNECFSVGSYESSERGGSLTDDIGTNYAESPTPLATSKDAKTSREEPFNENGRIPRDEDSVSQKSPRPQGPFQLLRTRFSGFGHHRRESVRGVGIEGWLRSLPKRFSKPLPDSPSPTFSDEAPWQVTSLRGSTLGGSPHEMIGCFVRSDAAYSDSYSESSWPNVADRLPSLPCTPPSVLSRDPAERLPRSHPPPPRRPEAEIMFEVEPSPPPPGARKLPLENPFLGELPPVSPLFPPLQGENLSEVPSALRLLSPSPLADNPFEQPQSSHSPRPAQAQAENPFQPPASSSSNSGRRAENPFESDSSDAQSASLPPLPDSPVASDADWVSVAMSNDMPPASSASEHSSLEGREALPSLSDMAESV